MVIQILEQFKNRLEYRILKDFYNCTELKLDDLQNGIIVLPGIVLQKMSNDEIKELNQWISNKDNQLILTPSWNEINLKDIFNLSIDMNMVNESSIFNDIPCNSYIQTTSKEKLYQNNGKVYAINHRNDISSGLITVVTLPLLDYKLIQHKEIFKSIFDGLIVVDSMETIADKKVEESNLKIDNLHIALIILVSAGVKVNSNFKNAINKYFKYTEPDITIQEKYSELINHGYIHDNDITELGRKIIKDKNLKSFINVVKERELNDDGWDE
ncbi:hypothetical protein [Paraclostridium bifermentans]|uniref:hypothetical protein n=1 Tax=Paraclostridium bifermentans TaxID=1490 RepID=UPI001FF58BBF|nr:hypothetical protein [Paraclostridium bifermentans]UOW69061.1 hypothetical protein MTR78_06420 [Paraclostridium bifermentans]